MDTGTRIRGEVESRGQVLIGNLELFLVPRSDVQGMPLDGPVAQFRLNQGNLVVRVRAPEWVSAMVLSTECPFYIFTTPRGRTRSRMPSSA